MVKMTKKAKSGLIVLIVFVVIALVVAGIQLYSTFKPSYTSPAKTSASVNSYANNIPSADSYNKKNYIATMKIEGMIEESNYTYDQKWILSTIDKLKYDPKNIGLAIYINSPGGAVYQADEVYLALQDYKTTGKKIYVYQGPLAASGGYYISCAGDKIYANRNTMTGSIGVIAGEFYDVTELLENIGIYAETIHSGRNKLLGYPTESLTDEQREIMQKISDECYDQFVSIVVSQRHLSFSRVEELADGRIYTAYQALDNGLIDQIDSWDNMLLDMMEDEFGYECKVYEYTYTAPFSLMSFIQMSVSDLMDKQAAVKLGVPASIIKQMNDFNSYPAYLYR